MIEESQIRQFFLAYENRVNNALTGTVEVQETVDAFAEFFVEASPAGVIGGKNDQQFAAKIPEGFQFYRDIGTLAMKINGVEVTALDDYHAMAKVHWNSFYERSSPIDFHVIYFVQQLKHQIKIFAYITGDEQKVMRENGLIQ